MIAYTIRAIPDINSTAIGITIYIELRNVVHIQERRNAISKIKTPNPASM